MNNEGMCGFVVFSYIVWLSALEDRLCLNAYIVINIIP
jgi:hypothetical protein